MPFQKTLCLLACAMLSLAVFGKDPRWFNHGLQIPDESYADQPYIVITKDGGWLCTLTTGPGKESQPGQHVVSTVSYDQGRTWSKPADIEPAGEIESSWVIPFVTPGGRIYAFYNYNGDNVRRTPDGKRTKVPTLFGWYVYKFSDDNGRTWSRERRRLPLPPAAVDLENDWKGKVQLFWGVDKPVTAGGDMLFAFTRMKKYVHDFGEGWFFRSNNILTEKDPDKINWQLLPETPRGVRNDDMGSIQEEHNVVPLANGDLFCVYRTTQGYPAGSYSRDGGRTWGLPEPLTYADGRTMRTPRACVTVWRTETGKYLLWYHNTSVQLTERRNNPAAYPMTGRDLGWLAGGIEKNGGIAWSQPELAAYVLTGGISYPDLVEADVRYFLSMTNKRDARLVEVDRELIEGLWRQTENKTATENGMLLTLASPLKAGSSVAMPRLPNPAEGGGFAFDFWVRLEDTAAEGRIVFDSRNTSGRGISVATAGNGALRLALNDGVTQAAWESDAGGLTAGNWHHVTINVDGGPKLMTFVVDGKLCDGAYGSKRLSGIGRFLPALDAKGKVVGKELGDVSGAKRFRLAPALRGEIRQFRVFGRHLRTAESIGNFNAGLPAAH